MESEIRELSKSEALEAAGILESHGYIGRLDPPAAEAAAILTAVVDENGQLYSRAFWSAGERSAFSNCILGGRSGRFTND